MRTPIIIGNWKMHTGLADAMVLTETIQHGLENIEGLDVVICPPFVWLYPVKDALGNAPPTHLHLGAQNVFTEEEGAFTGEVSIKMLRNLVRFVIVGHSERRYKIGQGEDDSTVNRKLKLVLAHGLHPILCVGERIKQIKRGRGRPRLEHGKDIVEQLQKGLDGVAVGDVSKVVIAYEPVWAISQQTLDPSTGRVIGTGDPATGPYANEQIGRLRDALAKWYGSEVAEVTRIIYGGSTDSANTPEFLQESQIDGLLPGGSSLKASEFLLMCKIAAERQSLRMHSNIRVNSNEP